MTLCPPQGPTPTATPADAGCCEEYAGLTRRGLLRAGGLAAATGALTATFGATTTQTAYAATRSAPRTLVLLSLRGAADGLSLVVPHADPVYYAARPRIAVPKASLLAVDAQFGLHPSLAPLLPMWQEGKVAAVHAVGLPAPNRSHFSAMEEVEDADPGSSARVGWLNRLIGRDGWEHPLRGMHLGDAVPPTTLVGPRPTFAATSVERVEVAAAGEDDGERGQRRLRALRTTWGGAGGPLGQGARSALGAVADFRPARTSPEAPRGGAVYPDSDLGQALASAARTIRADVGAEVITVDHGSWDMHTDVGNLEWGDMKNKATDLAKSLAAFFTDLGALGDQVTVVTVSEFGRRVKENANWGLDHGHGTVMLALGGGVKGGYVGRWPGLQNTVDADVLVTTDYRSVLAELVTTRFGASSAQVFPGFTPETVGVFRA